MKIRPLPEIDLARIAPQSKDQQRKQLEQMKFGRPPFSYAPLRSCFHDIFNVQPEMFRPVAPTEWSIIETRLRQKSKTNEEADANVAVAKGLHQFASESNLVGREQDFFHLAMSVGQKVSYWLAMVLADNGAPLVPFIDPRRSRGLNADGRRFVFSMMHERIRTADPDFEAVQFAIFQFGKSDEGQRNPVIYKDEGIRLFSLDELEAMVETTYAIWQEVYEERELETRRKGTSTKGPLI